MNRSTSTKNSMFSALFAAFAIISVCVLLSGCGKSKKAAAGPVMPVQPVYPQPGYSPFPGMPVGPVTFPSGGYCANSIPQPQGRPIAAQNLADVIVDGEGGCLRLIEVQQFAESTGQQGMIASSSATDTTIDYDFVQRGRGRRARYGTRTRVQSRNVCANARSAGLDTSVSLPLWIDRDTGAIGQNIRLQGGSRWSVADNGRGFDIDTFVRISSASGVQGMQAHRLASGDLEIYLSRTDYSGASGTVARILTRAVYRADY